MKKSFCRMMALSMMVILVCLCPLAAFAESTAAAPQETAGLSFAGQEIIKAMLYSEILSKPKALR